MYAVVATLEVSEKLFSSNRPEKGPECAIIIEVALTIKLCEF